VFIDGLGLGVRFSPDYFCLNGAGEVVESGELEKEPYFVAASKLATQYAGLPAFVRLAVMSADVNTVNGMLKAGSKPKDLLLSPAAMFVEPATPAGMEKARQFLVQRMSAATKLGRSVAPDSPPVKKPWWRFWQ
jgi:hypothetical protein